MRHHTPRLPVAIMVSLLFATPITAARPRANAVAKPLRIVRHDQPFPSQRAERLFARLAGLYESRVTAYTRSVLRHNHLDVSVADITQEAWQRALVKFDGSHALVIGFFFWIRAIVRNVVREHRRRMVRGRLTALDPVELDRSATRLAIAGSGWCPSRPDALVDEEFSRRVRELVARLPRLERDVVELHMFEGLTLRQAGFRLGVKEETATKRWQRACKRMGRSPDWRRLAEA